MNRPSLVSAIAALRTEDARFAHAKPTDEEADIAAVLEAVEIEHQPTHDEPDPRGRWGTCTGCHTPWPCERFVWAEHLAVQFLGRAADRYAARAQDAMARSRRTA